MNKDRTENGLSAVSIDTLELLMDRLEKESYFQAASSEQAGAVVDEDAVCCICLDGKIFRRIINIPSCPSSRIPL